MKFLFWNAGAKGTPDWRWHLRADNGEIVAQGEGYATKQKCLAGIDLVKMSGGAPILPRGTVEKAERRAKQRKQKPRK